MSAEELMEQVRKDILKARIAIREGIEAFKKKVEKLKEDYENQ